MRCALEISHVMSRICDDRGLVFVIDRRVSLGERVRRYSW